MTQRFPFLDARLPRISGGKGVAGSRTPLRTPPRAMVQVGCGPEATMAAGHPIRVENFVLVACFADVRPREARTGALIAQSRWLLRPPWESSAPI